MKQVALVEYIVKSLVEKPEDVRIDEIRNENTSILELRVNENDLGKIIGKKGRIAKSIRTLLLASENRKRRNFLLEIID